MMIQAPRSLWHAGLGSIRGAAGFLRSSPEGTDTWMTDFCYNWYGILDRRGNVGPERTMRKAIASLLILGVVGLNAAVLTASADCRATTGASGIKGGCCCGGDTSCDLPAGSPGVRETCCEVTQSGDPVEQATPATQAVTIVHQGALPAEADIQDPLAVTSAPRPAVPDCGSDRPPPYTLFCSLLI